MLKQFFLIISAYVICSFVPSLDAGLDPVSCFRGLRENSTASEKLNKFFIKYGISSTSKDIQSKVEKASRDLPSLLIALKSKKNPDADLIEITHRLINLRDVSDHLCNLNTADYRIVSAGDGTEPIDIFINHYIERYQKNCFRNYSQRLKSFVDEPDRGTIEFEQNIGKLLSLVAQEQPSMIIGLRSAASNIPDDIEPHLLVEFLESYADENHDYLLKDALLLWEIPEDENKVEAEMKRLLLEPCEDMVEKYRGLFETFAEDEEWLSKQGRCKPKCVLENAEEFYERLAEYKLCLNIVAQGQRIIDSLIDNLELKTLPESISGDQSDFLERIDTIEQSIK